MEGNNTNKCIYAFPFRVGKYREPQSINAKLFLPIIPIGIVAYAFTLLWDDLCRNSCMLPIHTRKVQLDIREIKIEGFFFILKHHNPTFERKYYF